MNMVRTWILHTKSEISDMIRVKTQTRDTTTRIFSQMGGSFLKMRRVISFILFGYMPTPSVKEFIRI